MENPEAPGCGKYQGNPPGAFPEPKREEKEEKKKNYYVRERHVGSVERRFALPEGVDTDHLEASFTQGVLTVKFPKKPEAIKPEKKIEVKTT